MKKYRKKISVIIAVLFLFSGCAGTGSKLISNPEPVKNKPAKLELTMEIVKKAIDDNLNYVKKCYEEALYLSSEIRGKIVMEWEIMPNGDVERVRLKHSTISDSELVDCIKYEISLWQFPEYDGVKSIVVSYPFAFNSH